MLAQERKSSRSRVAVPGRSNAIDSWNDLFTLSEASLRSSGYALGPDTDDDLGTVVAGAITAAPDWSGG